MKRLNKRDNVSSILKRRATTVMMAATVIGAVGLSSTLGAGGVEDLSLRGTEITIGNGEATVSDSGNNGNYGISTESQNDNT